MANKKQNKQAPKKTNSSFLKKILIILLIVGMLGMYVILPIMSIGA